MGDGCGVTHFSPTLENINFLINLRIFWYKYPKKDISRSRSSPATGTPTKAPPTDLGRVNHGCPLSTEGFPEEVGSIKGMGWGGGGWGDIRIQGFGGKVT